MNWVKEIIFINKKMEIETNIEKKLNKFDKKFNDYNYKPSEKIFDKKYNKILYIITSQKIKFCQN